MDKTKKSSVCQNTEDSDQQGTIIFAVTFSRLQKLYNGVIGTIRSSSSSLKEIKIYMSIVVELDPKLTYQCTSINEGKYSICAPKYTERLYASLYS
jgi:hypothetical protein